MFLNLCAGLDRLGVAYEINNYASIRADPGKLACIVGKPFLLDREWRNPILFGAAIYSHPIDAPRLFDRNPVRRVLSPGPWMTEMCRPYWGDRVVTWPVGIDTDHWRPNRNQPNIDVLLYDKVMWNRARALPSLVEPIKEILRDRGLSFQTIEYGTYMEEDFRTALSNCETMLFLCEHETQGIAYQQALSCGVPVLAWDPGGFWQDPAYYPHHIQFEPVSSVPYFDARCGDRFTRFEEFSDVLDEFWDKAKRGSFAPREFILENLTLEICSRAYLDHVHDLT